MHLKEYRSGIPFFSFSQQKNNGLVLIFYYRYWDFNFMKRGADEKMFVLIQLTNNIVLSSFGVTTTEVMPELIFS